MAKWKKKKGFTKLGAVGNPMGMEGTGRSPDASFIPEGASKSATKKQMEFHKRATPAPGGQMKKLIGEP